MMHQYDIAEDKATMPSPDYGGDSTHDHHAVHELQRSAGNAAVAAALQRDEHRSPVLNVVGRGGGRALPAALQRNMSTRFGGADFSEVRVHDDGAARESAAAVGARAYTTGHEVVLGDGVDLGSTDGQKTLAHELTHVLQQRSGPVDGTDGGNGVSISDPSDRFEREAEANANHVMRDGLPHPGGTAGAAPTTPADEVAAVQRELDPARDDEEEVDA